MMFSDNENGTPMYDSINQNTKYIGIYSDECEQDSKDPSMYVWAKYTCD